ncbi:MAG: glycosyltransferase [Alphaproteobacteria bacterium]|nr:glycosyltransferase [Alphaproteobacteria bacterium]MBU2380793.1 glycosyltransferase [Alphaproteobacteria bacterium]
MSRAAPPPPGASASTALRILVVGTHPNANQPSMSQFATWFEQALRPLGAVRRISAPAVFKRAPGDAGAAKWLAYLDQYVVLTLWLAVIHSRHDIIVVADHSNAPAAGLVPRSKLIVMVHDTIAIRQARGEIEQAPPVGATGRLLQRRILAGLRRAALLLLNPGPVERQLAELGVSAPCAMVGCPVDTHRLSEPVAPDGAPTGPYVLNVGGDGWRKRKGDLLRLWAASDQACPLPVLVLAGSTSDATRIELMRLGLQDRVRLYDDVSDGQLAWFYRHSQALVAAGHDEGFCIPVAEACSFGKPVFAPSTAEIYPMIFGDAVTTIDMDDPRAGAVALSRHLGRAVSSSAGSGRAIAEKWSQQAFEVRVRTAVAGMAPAGHDRRRAGKPMQA